MTKLRTLIPAVATTIAAVALVAAPAVAVYPDLEAGFLDLINQDRAGAGLSALTVHADLVDDARAHSLTMLGEQHLYHNPNLGDVTTGWHALGENVGVGPVDVPVLHQAFMNSPGHRANVLGDYNYVGIGVETETNRMWVTVVFMRKPVEAIAPVVAPAAERTPVPSATTSTVGSVDPTTGIWTLRTPDGQVRQFYYGNPGDYPMLGDWDCDGVATPGLYRQTDGYVYLRNSNTQGIADTRFYFGNPGDVPVAGDFNGDGCDTVAVYRPSQSTMFIINRLGSGEAGLGAADFDFPLGGPDRQVVAGDWDGDGVDTVVEPGGGGARFVAGDWDGDGVDTLGRWHDGFFELEGAGGAVTAAFDFGRPGDLPVSGSADLG